MLQRIRRRCRRRPIFFKVENANRDHSRSSNGIISHPVTDSADIALVNAESCLLAFEQVHSHLTSARAKGQCQSHSEFDYNKNQKTESPVFRRVYQRLLCHFCLI